MEEKNAAAVSLGSLGGRARAANLSPKRRREIALKASRAAARARTRKAREKKEAAR